MILLIVLDQFRAAVDRSGLIVLMILLWSLNCEKSDVDLSMIGVILIASGKKIQFFIKSEIVELLKCLKL